MYIYRIIINNFRNIKEIDWKPNKDLNIIFGSNGSGKSNIAIALDLLFNSNMSNDTFDVYDFYQCNIDNGIKIECWIDEVDSLETQLSTSIQHIDEHDMYVEDDSTSIAKTVIILRLESEGLIKKWSVVQSTETNELKSSLRKSINYTYLSSDRNPDKDINLSKSGLFYKSTRKNDELWGKLASTGTEIVKNINEELIKDEELNKIINNEFNDEHAFFHDVSIGVKDISSTYFQSGYQFMIDNNNYILPIDKYSTGQQNLFLFDLILKSLDENSITYIEEIEQNLEPVNQKRLALRIRNRINGQLFITSHSVSLLEYFGLSEMFLLNQGHVIKVLDENKSEEREFEVNVLKGNKKDFLSSLMSNGVLLCEGSTEYSTLPIYDEYYNNVLLDKSIEIIKVDGKAKFESFLNIFKKCAKKTYVLIDKDKDFTSDLKNIKKLVDKVYVQNDSYEDLVYQDIKPIVNKLDDLIPFSQIKNFLLSVINDDRKEYKQYMTMEDLNNISSYSDLYTNEKAFKKLLHDKFVSSFFARNLAIMISKNNVPKQYIKLFNSLRDIESSNDKIDSPKVIFLGESC